MNTGRKIFALCSFLTITFAAGLFTADAQIYSGRATGLRSAVTVNGNTTNTTVADTCPLSPTGGSNIVTTPVGFISGLARTGIITSTTSGAGLTSQASSTVQDLNLSAGGYTIRATSVASTAQCNCCTPSNPSCGGRTTIVGLTVTDPAGNPVTVVPNGSTNQTITLPNNAGTIIINEQIASPGMIDVNAIHVNITGASGSNSNVVVAGSHADIDCTTTSPTPGQVVVTGRVYDSAGRGLSKATVVLRSASGAIVSTTTNSLGNFTLPSVTAGETYILETTHASYTFSPIALNLNEDTAVEVRPDGAARAALR